MNTQVNSMCVYKLSEEHFRVQLYNFVNMHATQKWLQVHVSYTTQSDFINTEYGLQLT